MMTIYVSLPFALQVCRNIVSICDEYCANHSITYNVKKSVCIFFKCPDNKHCDNSTVFLSGNQIDFVYLGLGTSIDV